MHFSMWYFISEARETYLTPLENLRDIKADILFSGNPCQDFSQIGKHKELECERGKLFDHINWKYNFI